LDYNGIERKYMKKLIIFLAVLFFASLANATDRYVDSAAGGTGDGTIGDPWETIADAVGGSDDGDLIYLKGVIAGGKVFSSEPKAFNWEVWPGESINITQGSGVSPWTHEGSGAQTFTGITFTLDESADLSAYSRVIRRGSSGGSMSFSGCTLTMINSRTGAISQIISEGADGGDFLFDSGIINVATVAGTQVFVMTFTSAPVLSITNTAINYLTADKCTFGGQQSVDSFIFTDNIITSSGNLVAGGAALNAGGAFATGATGAVNARIERNTISITGTGNGIITRSFERGNHIFSKNFISITGAGAGILSGLDAHPFQTNGQASVTMSENTLLLSGHYGTNNTGHGLGVFYPYDLTMRNNYVSGADFNLAVKSDTPNNPVVISGNAFINGKSAGVTETNVIIGTVGAIVTNNLFFEDGTGPSLWCFIQKPQSTHESRPTPTDTIFKNNLIITASTVDFIRNYADGTFADIDKNSYYYTDAAITPTTDAFRVNGATISVNEWQALDYDINSLFIDPKIIWGYVPIPRYDSPLIGAGDTIGAAQNSLFHPLTNTDAGRIFTVEQSALWDIGATKYIGNDGLR
jgi:hypothetical protein